MAKRNCIHDLVRVLAVTCLVGSIANCVRADDENDPGNQFSDRAEVVVRSIDGETISGALLALDAETLIFRTNDADERSLPLSEVMSITQSSNAESTAETPPLVLLANDDVLCGVVTSLDDETLTLDWQVTSPATSVSVPLEHVRSIVFRQPREPLRRSRIQRIWALLETKSDRLISTDYTHVDGELTALNERRVKLKTPLGEVSNSSKDLFAVILNSELTSVPTPESSYVLGMLKDGSRVTWDTWQLTEEGRLSGTTVWGTPLSVPADQIEQLQFLGDRIVAVAELPPREYQFTPYLTEQHPLVRNRNVQGGPLRVRGTWFATGLGVHSQSAVTYDLTVGRYQQFLAVIGVDDLTQGGGNVVFAVEVDGQRAYESPTLTGRSPATPIEPVDVTGAKSLKLIVEFGDSANIGDVANWCDLVLIKAAN
ncbi:MAG: NPCBM/NEW2 domain-containing protein [Planctomycetaceae bacterium]|nr:NPCBM/NEW2 domain-containing protein [Planctomycetaceae bacterium]